MGSLPRVHVGYQRPELMRDANSNHGRPVDSESCSESRLDFFCRFSSHSGTPKCLDGCDDIESGQIKRWHIGGFFKYRKLFEDRVLVVAEDDVDELYLLGSMLAGILVENGEAGILVPQLPFGFAQAVVGCMIARVLTSTIIHSFLHEWPLFLGISFLVIVASCLLGWLISRFRILPETTAIWGLLPGAAPAMMVMADAYGADARLVAFMQYVRVLMVALVASIIARFWVHAPAVAAAAPAVWFAPIHALPFLETLVLVLGGVILGPVSRIPAGILLIPMFLGAVLQSNGLVEIELPSWLLAVSYLLLGWTIGLRFTREILVYAIRALPKMIVSILMLIAFCGGLAFALVEVFDIDPLTAYLATSPGGADSVAIIAASTNVDVGFVMAQQIARFMLVLIVGPALSRFVADQIARNVPNISDKTPT
jgi:membrane AbrB-like protein